MLPQNIAVPQQYKFVIGLCSRHIQALPVGKKDVTLSERARDNKMTSRSRLETDPPCPPTEIGQHVPDRRDTFGSELAEPYTE